MRSLRLCPVSRRVSAATTSQRACLRHPRCSLSTYGDLTAAALSEASSEGPSLDVLDALTEASPPQPVSISQMMLASGRTSPAVRLANAQFLRRELASRRAHVLSLLRTMPPPLASQPAVARLCVLNWQRLKGLLALPELSTADDEKAFAAAMLDHSAAIDGESRRWPHLSPEEEALCVDALGTLQREPHLAVDKQLDAIFLARIGLRVLHEHYIRAVQPPRQGYAGAIQLECSPVALCEEAAAATRQQLQQRYGAAPPVEVVGERGHSFAFVPGHVRAVVGALLFNSSVATLRHAALAAGGGRHQQHSFSGDERLPAVRVIVAGGDDLVQVKLLDQAGGIRRSSLSNVWSYRALDSAWWRPADGLSLPLTRLFCQYFGGSLALVPVEGVGTDCYVAFNRRAEDNVEVILPRARLRSSTGGIFDAQERRA